MNAFASKVNGGLTSKYKFIRSINTNGQQLMAPRVQDPAPHFEGTAVYNMDFKEIKLSDYKGKYVIFYFYPLDFTFVCPTEIIAFSEKYEEFQKINADVIGCSTDSHFSHLAWQNVSKKDGGIGSIKYPLLSDFTKTIAKSYGVLIESSGIALRGLFIIDDKGIIRHTSVNDLPVGRSVDEVLRLVKAFQFNDKHGEVCPANWQPDTDTIKPTVKDSKEFFDKTYEK
ncbi:Peroxiredoxin-1, putative [Pediculus humanus corporis]|uniref:thioredoxin-dependent peroxiredoxin n=1 Tax=Pediculus humanus subsp. corporis TaxID=121224 RepID=E0VUL8_PEDHC|nr:Peroxiredoxin-1, putative [Pediculus humanus corporis]EEB17074.1 Peroxiredoxin-1, putative [Pediculus humanus corporis]